MNIGILQLSNISTNGQSPTITKEPSNSGNFGDIFSQIANKEEVLQYTTESSNLVNFEKLEDLLSTSTIKEVLNLLGISETDEMDENIEYEVPVDLLNSDELIKVLQIDYEELMNAFEEFFGVDQHVLNETWDLISIINNQSQELLSNGFLKGLNGELDISPQATQQLLHFLKVVEIAGSNSTLTLEQQNQIIKLKELLQEISKELEVKNNQSNNNLIFTKVVNYKLQSEQPSTAIISNIKRNNNTVLFGQNQIQNNSEKVLASTVKQLLVNNEQNEESASNVLTPTSSTMISSKNFTITLPVEKSAQSEAFVKEFQSLLNKSQLSNSQGTMKLLVKLYPENLGSIRIEILQNDGVLSARLLASTSQAKELLDSQIQQLKTVFAQQNIQMDRIDIAQSLQETDRNLRDQSLFGNMFNDQQSGQNDDEHEENNQEQSMSFEDYLLNEEV
ncbi:flagellar hook-length control protein FliK [Lysinibacillus endophyticus]|uniref:flagellar hook-length control protein FliK n=1 Tax=Ureibacillus endophyticus TaxID=1978490 RepID=UPI00313726D1